MLKLSVLGVETAVTDSSDVSDAIHGLLNSTDSELSSLSHLDAPSDSVYMIFGVLIAMVLVALIIILLAVTISKLRKREEHHSTPSAAAPTDVVLHTTTTTTATPPPPAAVTSAAGTPTQPPTSEQKEGGFLGLWQYPQQYVLNNANDKETLVTPVVLERSKFGRGIRKNLSGRWKRLTKKKPVNEVYTIPADLRDQLKSIYVY